VERTFSFALLVQTLVVIWYARHGYDRSGISDRHVAELWYAAKTKPTVEAHLRRHVH
jgi:hypothetical protein